LDGNLINAMLGDPLQSAFVDHVTQDLTAFLGGLGASLSSGPGTSAS
jgi:hypothetical protein